MDLKLGTALMMFIRIKALYYNQKFILGFVVLVGLASFITNAYSLTGGVIFVHNPESGVHGKILCFSADLYSWEHRWFQSLYSGLLVRSLWSTRIEHYWILEKSDKLASISIKLPLIYDTLVLGLTLYKTYASLGNKTTSYVMRRLAKDGILYYRY